jgi:hypothetical protein
MLALRYVFILLAAIAFILLAVNFSWKLYKSYEQPPAEMVVDVSYACSNYNNTVIGLDEFRTLLYGFTTGQCDFVTFRLKENMSIDDLKRMVDVNVIKTKECKLPTVNTHTLYVSTTNDKLNSGKIINVVRRKIKNGDILVCEQP